MSRSGYSDDDEDGTLWLWRRAVSNAIHGKRGQAFLREMLAALDALPNKRLVASSFQRTDGEVCALGAIGIARKTPMTDLGNAEDCNVATEVVGERFGIARSMAAEIMFENDDDFGFMSTNETPEQRFIRMRKWVVTQLETDTTP